jgi:hypothetical protein
MRRCARRRRNAAGGAVWNCKAIAAGGAADSEFDGAVVVLILFYYGIVIDDISEAVFWDIGIADRNDSFDVEKANEFVSFGPFPLESIRAIFR